jgi:hypothetical protein
MNNTGANLKIETWGIKEGREIGLLNRLTTT